MGRDTEGRCRRKKMMGRVQNWRQILTLLYMFGMDSLDGGKPPIYLYRIFTCVCVCLCVCVFVCVCVCVVCVCVCMGVCVHNCTVSINHAIYTTAVCAIIKNSLQHFQKF